MSKRHEEEAKRWLGHTDPHSADAIRYRDEIASLAALLAAAERRGAERAARELPCYADSASHEEELERLRDWLLDHIDALLEDER